MEMPVGAAFWGKLESRDDVPVAWHPLVHHCADVAACAEALLTQSLLRKRLARLAGRDDLDEVTIARLCVFAALHDLGKFNQHFQNKGRPGSQPRAGHVRELLWLFDGVNEQEAFYAALAPLPLADWSAGGEAATSLLLAAIAHHGRPIPVEQPGVTHDSDRWRAAHGVDPFKGMRALAVEVARWFPTALGDGPLLPESAAFQHAFAGLVMLADWLGSDRDPSRFPFSTSLTDDRIVFARQRAAIALQENGIALGLLGRALAGEITYARFSDIAVPRDAQAKLLDLPALPEGTLTLLEAETGSGKTEAALAHFFKLFQSGAVEGMYFALPTRTAATQIYRRVVDAVQRLFAGTEAPPVVLAVPGYLDVDGVEGQALPDFKVLWKDDARTTAASRSWRHRAWAAEQPKRYLAASIAVGTIDQCLMSTLMTDHAHLRATTLLRSLLVVDEVHASDVYMTALLRHVLQFHRAAGGHALLMSATLGAAARDLYLGDRVETPYATAREEPYPRITFVAPGRPPETLAPSGGASKSIHVETGDWIDDPAALARAAFEAAARGARVLVLRNTVRACIETQRAVEAVCPRELRFQVGGLDTAHHARFVREDRQRLDDALEEQFGKRSTVRGRIVVATQTVQQSLDLDADLLLTDLCPMDVLLQRMGRLHRHQRARPEGFERARCVVLSPAEHLGTLIGSDGVARGAHGFGSVYSDLRVLLATLGEIHAHPIWEIPRMNRSLVEAATHPEVLRTVAPSEPRWLKHASTVGGVGLAHQRIAETNVVDRQQHFGQARFADLQAPTRLGLNDRRVELPFRCQTPLGNGVLALTIPAWLVAGADEDAVAMDVRQSSDHFAFAFGKRRYRYDRLGLHVVDDSPAASEDDA
jgi:CRISPR-associated endonuclease/helicase Cas3